MSDQWKKVSVVQAGTVDPWHRSCIIPSNILKTRPNFWETWPQLSGLPSNSVGEKLEVIARFCFQEMMTSPQQLDSQQKIWLGDQTVSKLHSIVISSKDFFGISIFMLSLPVFLGSLFYKIGDGMTSSCSVNFPEERRIFFCLFYWYF